MVLSKYLQLLPLLLALLVLPLPAAAASDQASPSAAAAAELPSLSELGTRSARLADFLEKSTARLESMADIDSLVGKRQELADKVQELQRQIAALGAPEEWYIERLTQYNDQFNLAGKAAEQIRMDLAGRQREVEGIRAQQQEEQAFWNNWREELKTRGDRVPGNIFTRADAQLAQLAVQLQRGTNRLTQLQEQVSAVEHSVIETQDRFSRALLALRKATFRKNSFSFFSPDFYRQFTPQLWSEMRSGLRNGVAVDLETLKHSSWAYLLFLFVLIFLAKGIEQSRDRFAEAEEWQFVFAHPWAAGSFIASISVGNLIPAPPAIVTFALLAVGVTGAAVLASALIHHRQQAVMLLVAAFFFLMTAALRFIALPQPLFRIYLALLALAAIPLLIQQIRLAKRNATTKGGAFFRKLMRVAVVVLFFSFAGQATGYVNFSLWLFQAVFDSAMIILFVHMGLRLGQGGISFLLNRETLAKYKFFRKYRQDVAERLGVILKLLVFFFAFLHLLPIWRVFGGPRAAWDFLADYSITFGEVEINLQMVGLAAVSLYLALQLSWLLQALCETQVFYRKAVDRGVRDAIKKLIHYGVVLVGFLVALSSLGMNLQHFVVILGALGVGIGFGLQDIVNNFLSGIILLFERPIKVGDGILVDGEYGTVKTIGLRSTVVETLDQAELIVPNSQMISQKVTNWTLSNRRVRIVIPVGVAYGSPVPQVLSILAEVAAQHSEVLEDPEPSPIFISFGDSSLDFELRAWIENIDGRPRIKSELLQQIDNRFREEKIQIPFPQRDLHLRSIDLQGTPEAEST
ncbi:MAG: mechanosensitive ion channel [Desulfuromonadales bacterium]|nr:mechanosensitive ion channel [Desulfuromonadales bacterium]